MGRTWRPSQLKSAEFARERALKHRHLLGDGIGRALGWLYIGIAAGAHGAIKLNDPVMQSKALFDQVAKSAGKLGKTFDVRWPAKCLQFDAAALFLRFLIGDLTFLQSTAD